MSQASTRPTITAPLKLDGIPIGNIVIQPDGSFQGSIDVEVVRERLCQVFEVGHADGIVIAPHFASPMRFIEGS